jgi:WD40 repeat protein
MALCLHGDLLFSGSTDGCVKVWCLRECKYLRTLRGHRDPIRALAVAPGAGVLLSAGAKTVRLWALDGDFACTAVLQASDIRGSIKALAAGPDGTIYTGGQDCVVKAYRAADLQGLSLQEVDSPRCMLAEETVRSCVRPAREPAAASPPAHAHCSSVTALAVCGAYVCSGSSDSTIRVWRAGSLEFVRALRGHRGSVLALHAVGGLLLSGGRDQLVRVWDGDTLVCRRALSGHTDDILHITSLAAPSASRAARTASFSFAAAPELAGLASPQLSISLDLPPPPALGRGGAGGEEALLFATSSADGTVRLWSARRLTCVQVCSAQDAAGLPATSCALTRAYAASGVTDGTIHLYGADDVAAAAAAELRGGGEGEGGAWGEGQPAAKRPRVAANGGTGVENGGGGAVVEAQAPAVLRLEREFERALRAFIKIP